jgi:hypothetical protein
MHFRTRNNTVQLIRTQYDAEKKRGRNEVVGTVPLRNLALPDDVAAKLTPEEKQEFDAFAVTYRNSKALQAKIYAFQISDIVEQAMHAADTAEGSDQEIMLANLSSAATEIRTFLNRQEKGQARKGKREKQEA